MHKHTYTKKQLKHSIVRQPELPRTMVKLVAQEMGSLQSPPSFLKSGYGVKMISEGELPSASLGKTRIGESRSSLVELPCTVQHSDPFLHPHSWVVGNWSRCSRTCDAGVRSRSVVCQRRVSAAEEKALDDNACPQPRPPVLEACQGPMCPPEWAALDWSEVSFYLSSHPTHSQFRKHTELGCLCGKAVETILP